MRALLAVALLGACSIPDKEAPSADGGVDGAVDALPDDGPLETTITSAPTEFTNQGLAVFEFNGGRSDAIFSCSVDGESAVACTSPFSRALGDGPHTFSVRAALANGETDDTPAEHLWTTDTVPPETMLTAAPPQADNSTMVKFEFTASEMNVAFECSLDGGAYLPCASGDSVGPLTDGTHSFAVRAQDRAGNLDASPAIDAWSLDTSTPDTQILTAPDAAISATSASFTFLSPDAGGGATFECALDAATFAACASPTTLTALTEGAHTFQVRVKDSVGNVDPSPAMAMFKVDRTPPETTISTGPTGTIAQASASFAFTANEPATFLCKLDARAEAPCTSPASYTALPQGAHAFTVHAVDAAGNTDATPAAHNWTVDTVAPDVAITAGPTGTAGPRASFVFTASEGAVTCSLDGATPAACAQAYAASVPEGAHSFVVKAIDAAGNSAMATRSWTTACAAPVAAGAAGLLHFDDMMQMQPNAVAGGAQAMLGDTTMPEMGDPKSQGGGRYNKALKFDAMPIDHVTWPVALDAGTGVAFEMWVKPTSAGGSLLENGDGRLKLALSGSTIVAGVAGQTATSAPIALNAWHHVALSIDTHTLYLYVDGVRTGAADLDLAPLPALDTLRLGGTTGAGFDGMLDEAWLDTAPYDTDDRALANYCPIP